MDYKIIKTKTIDLPKTIKLSGYGETMEFNLSHKRELKVGPNDEEIYQLKDDEAFYQTKFGWGVFVDIDKMETINYDKTEWGGQKIN